MNEITPNSQSTNHFNVLNPSPAILEEAKRLNTLLGTNAKVFPSGNVCFHNNFKLEIEFMINREANENLLAPEFSSIDEMENWVYDNVGGKAAQEIARMTAKQFNANFSGLTVSQIKAKA